MSFSSSGGFRLPLYSSDTGARPSGHKRSRSGTQVSSEKAAWNPRGWVKVKTPGIRSEVNVLKSLLNFCDRWFRLRRRSLLTFFIVLACCACFFVDQSNLPSRPFEFGIVVSQKGDVLSGLLRRPHERPEGVNIATGRHTYRSDGLLEVNLDGPHPIFELVNRAEQEWNAKLARASKTLEEGVREYVRRYGRAPPKGFDKWWKYAEERHVLLPDEYDIINDRLEPFWGVEPSFLRATIAEWEDTSTVPTMTFGNSGAGLPIQIIKNEMLNSKKDAFARHLRQRLSFLKEVELDLPEFRAIINPLDEPNLNSDWAMLEEARQAAARGTYIDMSIPRGRKPGWLYACKPHSPALEARSSLSLNESILEQILSSRSIHKTFVYDHDHAMDPCLHPSILYQNGGFKMLRNGPATFNKLIPQFSSSITHLHYDLLPIPPPGWAEDEVRGRVPWEEKTQNRLLWRGTNTGMWASNETGYRDSQRFRLVELANRKDGEATVLRSPKRGEENAKVGEGERWDRNVLEEETVDIAFAGDPIQCEEPSCTDMKNEFRWAGRMDTNESNQYKYIIDVDGNGWSSRFRRQIGTSDAVIFKASAYREWFVDRIQPWVHYVPISHTYSELHDVLLFFRGDPNGEGGHDKMARRIAREGSNWVERFWRREDSTAYMYRMLLEYARVTSLDREAMSMDISGFNFT